MALAGARGDDGRMPHALEPTAETTTRADPSLAPVGVDVRIRIAALWASVLFAFAYVDLFGLYRPDERVALAAGRLGGMAVDQPFLLGTTAYVLLPSLMIPCALVLRPRVSRIANIALSVGYAVSVVVSAIGEWSYYVLASAVEVGLLAAIAWSAWTWPGRRGTRR